PRKASSGRRRWSRGASSSPRPTRPTNCSRKATSSAARSSFHKAHGSRTSDMIDQGTLLNFVGGTWQRADARENVAVHNPATGEVISSAPLSENAAVARAVEAAQKALP